MNGGATQERIVRWFIKIDVEKPKLLDYDNKFSFNKLSTIEASEISVCITYLWHYVDTVKYNLTERESCALTTELI